MLFFFVGPNAVAYIPRCMAGCVMTHLGWDLLKESLIDTYDQLDTLELGTVWAITGTMTFWDMNQGLAVGELLACTTFVMQSARTPTNVPIRGSMRAATLRSHTWRTTDELDVLDRECRNIHVVQPKGHLFFGNINQLSDYVRNLFEQGPNSGVSGVETSRSSALGDDMRPQPDIRWLVLDFTLVVGLGSSAADRLTKIKYACDSNRCKLVFVAVPRAYKKFTEHLVELFGDHSSVLHIAADLDSALDWCENDILGINAFDQDGSPASSCAADEDEYTHLRNLRRFMPDQP